jgi:methyl-accepting chemotaxis protein
MVLNRIGGANMSVEEYINKLIEVSDKKYSLLKDILFITRDQSKSLNEDGIEALQKLIEEKQKKIDEINKIDETFDVYFKRLKQTLGIKSLDEVKGSEINGIGKLKDAVGGIMTIVNEISEIEKSNNRKAKEVLDSLANKIRQANQGKQLSNAYMPVPGRMPSYFIDKKK